MTIALHTAMAPAIAHADIGLDLDLLIADLEVAVMRGLDIEIPHVDIVEVMTEDVEVHRIRRHILRGVNQEWTGQNMPITQWQSDTFQDQLIQQIYAMNYAILVHILLDSKWILKEVQKAVALLRAASATWNLKRPATQLIG